MARYIQLCLVSSLLWGLAPAAPPREGKPEILTTHNVFSLRRSFVHRPKVFVDHRHWKYKCAQHDGGGGRSSHQGTDTPAKSDSKPSKDSKDSTAAGISGSPVTSVNQVEYITGVVADGNRYNLIVDTGSSDTFIVNNGFVCLDEKKQKVAEQVCKFGPPFKGPFSGGTVPNTHFSITYGNGGSGPALHGTFGYSSLTVAGVAIKKQQIALATTGSWSGDGVSSGILGLGLRGLTEAWTGSSPSSKDGTSSQYDPVSANLGSNTFSLGLSRNEADSFLAIGGVPANVKMGTVARVPIQKLQLNGGGSDYLYYIVAVDQIVWTTARGQAGAMKPGPHVIVDSGTTLNLFPPDVADAINGQFTPPAQYDADSDCYTTACNAVPPKLGVQIGGQMLWTDATNMILTELKDQKGLCCTGITMTKEEPYILGDTFMQGLVVVFDVGPSKTVSFAKRT